MEPIGEQEAILRSALELIKGWRERIGLLDDDCSVLGQIAKAALDGEPIPPDNEIWSWAWKRSRPDLWG